MSVNFPFLISEFKGGVDSAKLSSAYLLSSCHNPVLLPQVDVTWETVNSESLKANSILGKSQRRKLPEYWPVAA